MLPNSRGSWLRMLQVEAPLDRLLKPRYYNDSVHIDTRSHDLVWIQMHQFNELLNFNNSKLGGGCHCRIHTIRNLDCTNAHANALRMLVRGTAPRCVPTGQTNDTISPPAGE